ncbi:uncharacterized protein BT62DRAFT_937974 [Guyanagaster necrorhizus]|uniref:Endoglucanase n=1 Tax=Guyanagaster necrorhizus TaxID=856835 RepID=A0A9P8AM91_9AGAR|nr:uncharacterized protein BT62DRAFT_937974 [Guyanagaster necrorhizus MCA 3950]KAG7440436.1 hypothetical protein BT62DRAFT_937974 [Guyanagaster necrorhizus MCA 3950]
MLKLSAILLTLGSSALAGYVQKASGNASFTYYSGCSSPACGKTATGYTAAMNQLAFGASSGLGAGDACGRCFAITGLFLHVLYTGGSSAFFPSSHGALTGTFEEVECSEWTGSDGSSLWTGACLDGEDATFWPTVDGCGNQGTAP